MAQKREVDIDILGVKFKVVPQNGRQEYEWRLMAPLTIHSLGYQGGLPLLQHERLMVPKEFLKKTAVCKVGCIFVYLLRCLDDYVLSYLESPRTIYFIILIVQCFPDCCQGPQRAP